MNRIAVPHSGVNGNGAPRITAQRQAIGRDVSPVRNALRIGDAAWWTKMKRLKTAHLKELVALLRDPNSAATTKDQATLLNDAWLALRLAIIRRRESAGQQ